MEEFDRSERALVIGCYGKAKIVARLIESHLGSIGLGCELEDLDRDEVLEIERDVRGQLLMPQRCAGAE